MCVSKLEACLPCATTKTLCSQDVDASYVEWFVPTLIWNMTGICHEQQGLFMFELKHFLVEAACIQLFTYDLLWKYIIKPSLQACS